jgi:class 3 adenylate cyclase/tetratricopeptide (TPR) repeat protein
MPTCFACKADISGDTVRCGDCDVVIAMRCPDCSTVNQAKAKFCSQCGLNLESSPILGQGRWGDRGAERRQLTVMFYDLVGSTGLAAKLDPEDVRDFIGTFHRHIAEIMVKFRGFVAQHMGDGGLVYFGYPNGDEDSVEHAIRAGLDAVEAVGELRLPSSNESQAVSLQQPRIRVGIATGMVVVGETLGTGSLSAVDAAGETPNLASRMQSLAEPNTVIIDAQTQRLAGRLFEYRDLGPIPLKGYAQPARVWQVMRGAPRVSRFEARRDCDVAQLIGRRKETAILLNRWRQARAGHGQVVLISGEAGIGKSHLTAVVLGRLRNQRHARLRYFCSARQQDSPLDPFIRQIESAAGFEPNDSPLRKREKLDRAFAQEGQRAEDVALIANLLSLPEGEGHQHPQMTPQQRRLKTIEALIRQPELLFRDRPLLTIFEDVHWLDPTSIELLNMAIARTAVAPVLLVVTFRPGFSLSLGKEKHVTHIALGPLPPPDAAALVRRFAGEEHLPAEIVNEIVERTDGVPLFLEELTRAVRDTGATDKALRPGASPSVAQDVPPTLQASLLARLDRLGSAKAVAQIAAAIGRDFSRELLAAVTRASADQLTRDLNRLVESGVVSRRRLPDFSYTFRHVLLRDAAYGTLLRETRYALHQRIVHVLERDYPDVVARQPELLAQHCADARLAEKSAGYWLRAGQQALGRSAILEAIARLRRGLQIAKTVPDQPTRGRCELKLELALGPALIAAKGYTAAETIESYARARELSAHSNLSPQLVAVLHGQWMQALMRNEMTQARQLSEELHDLGQARNDLYWRWQGSEACGVTCFPTGDFVAARHYLEEALALYHDARESVHPSAAGEAGQFLRLLNLDEGHVVVLAYLSWVLLYLGHFEEARARCTEALDNARRFAQAYPLTHALNGAAFVELTLGNYAVALSRLDELDATLEEHGIAYYRSMSQIWRGWCLAALGEPLVGLQHLARGLAAYRAAGTEVYVPAFLRFFAEAYRVAGQPEAALAQLDEAARIMLASHAQGDEGEMLRVRGLSLLDLNDPLGAEECLRAAIKVARRKSAKLWELRAATDLAHLLRSRGRSVEAHQMVLCVCGLFPEEAAPDVARARALLEELGRLSRIAPATGIRA